MKSKSHDLSPVRKVLVIRIDKVGDLLLSTPAIRSLREALPGARITLLATPYNAGIMKGWDALDQTVIYDRSWSKLEKLRFIRGLRRDGYDMCIVLSPLMEAYQIARLSGARIRAGLIYSRRLIPRLLSPVLLTHRLVLKIDEAIAGGAEIPHEVDQMLDIVRLVGLPAKRTSLEIPLSSDDREWAHDFLQERCGNKTIIGLHLSFKWLTGGWTAADMAGLLEQILEATRDSYIVITFGPADIEAAKELSAFVDGFEFIGNETGGTLSPIPCQPARESGDSLDGNAVMVGGLPFGRWAGIFDCCRLVVSLDTGSLHLATAIDKPVVAVYEKDTFDHCTKQWAPWQVPNRIVKRDDFSATSREILSGLSDLLKDITS